MTMGWLRMVLPYRYTYGTYPPPHFGTRLDDAETDDPVRKAYLRTLSVLLLLQASAANITAHKRG
jgi:hypothetical protein